jgi:hypothetical protein
MFEEKPRMFKLLRLRGCASVGLAYPAFEVASYFAGSGPTCLALLICEDYNELSLSVSNLDITALRLIWHYYYEAGLCRCNNKPAPFPRHGRRTIESRLSRVDLDAATPMQTFNSVQDKIADMVVPSNGIMVVFGSGEAVGCDVTA